MGFAGRFADFLDPPPITAQSVWRDYGWTPQPKQLLAEHMAGEVDELLFGGAAGGGKSEMLLWHAIAEMERYAGNRGVIFRRDMPRLERSLLPRAEAALYGRARYNANKHTFTFPNGSVLEFAHLERLASVHKYQGSEYGFVAFEEVTEFLEEQWDDLSVRLRAPADGVRPHMMATTNPGGPGHRWVKRRWVKPLPGDVVSGDSAPALKWMAKPHTDGAPPITRCFIPSTIDDNPALVARDPGYMDRTLARVANRAKRQAMAVGDWDAIDQIEGALWDWEWIEPRRVDPAWPLGGAGGLARVVVAVDPAASAKPGSDETGIVVAGVGYDGRGYVLADRSCRMSPDGWGRRAVEAYREHRADRVVVERNNGGDMVIPVITSIDDTVPVSTVWASRGKRTRAEPIAALYEAGKVSHAGTFADMEEQLTTWVPEDGDSPDRLDALVWALTELMLGGQRQATVTEYRNDALDGSR